VSVRPWLALLAFSLLSMMPRVAAATAGSAPIVHIEVEGSPAAVDRLRTTALEVLGRLGVVPVVVAAPAPDARALPVPLVQAQVDLRNPRQPSLVVRDGASGRELSRRTLDQGASLETSVEAAVLVVYMIVEARLSEETAPSEPASPGAVAPGAVAPSATEAAPAPATTQPPSAVAPRSTAAAPTKRRQRRPEPPPPEPEIVEESEEMAEPERPSAPSAWTLSAGALLRLGTLDNASAITGAGLVLEARAKRSKFGGLLLGAAHVPSDVHFASSYADVHTVSARLLLTQGFELGSSVSALIGLGPGIDWLRSVPEAAPVEVRTGTANVVDPILSAAFGARLALGGHALLMAAACLDLDLAPHTFVIDVGNERHTLLAPDRLRPSLFMAIAYTSGDDHTASAASSTEVW
jgi:hypothetical protein